MIFVNVVYLLNPFGSQNLPENAKKLEMTV